MSSEAPGRVKRARATHRRPAGLLLFPGAGAGRDQSALVAIDEAVSALGVHVERADFPYRIAGRRAPDRPAVLVAHVGATAKALADSLCVGTAGIVLGGRSMGGRMCSMAVGDGLAAAGLALVSYPLHPPGRPDRPRTEHLGRLEVPCLFCSGTRDAFASVEELREATGLVPGRVDLELVEGADHSMRRRDGEVAALVATWIAALGAPRHPRQPRADPDQGVSGPTPTSRVR